MKQIMEAFRPRSGSPHHDIPIPVRGKRHGTPYDLTEALDMTLKKMQ